MPPIKDFDRNVFINCPYDNAYMPILRAILFTVKRCGYIPKMALERLDSVEVRIDKICKLVGQSKYSIHDLSRIDKKALPRFNMPFELGIDVGIRKKTKNKKCLILVPNRHGDIRKVLSDIGGNDVVDYGKDNQLVPEIANKLIRDWFLEEEGDILPSATQIWDDYNTFNTDIIEMTREYGHKEKDITNMNIVELMKFMDKWFNNKSSK